MHAAYSLTNFSGQSRDRQDSVLSRLRHLLPDGMLLNAVHRLDQDTSQYCSVKVIREKSMRVETLHCNVSRV